MAQLRLATSIRYDQTAFLIGAACPARQLLLPLLLASEIALIV
jgi:hypothetical protein